MNTIATAIGAAAGRAIGFVVLLVGAAHAQEDWQPVAQALGERGTASGGVFRGRLPRTDIKAHSTEYGFIFMHFWAHDDALKLAVGLKAALGHVHIVKS